MAMFLLPRQTIEFVAQALNELVPRQAATTPYVHVPPTHRSSYPAQPPPEKKQDTHVWSWCAAFGAISLTANSFAVSANICCSLVKFRLNGPAAAQEVERRRTAAPERARDLAATREYILRTGEKVLRTGTIGCSRGKPCQKASPPPHNKKGQHVRTPGRTNRNTRSVLMAPPLPSKNVCLTPCVTFCQVVVSLRGPGQSPVLPFACCVGSLLSVGRCGRCSCWCRFRVRGAQ